MSMCDEYMPLLQLPMTLEQFHQLPRNPAYRYEYVDGQAFLTPRARHYHAVLQLGPNEEPQTGNWTIRPAEDADLPRLEALFVAAFRRIQPFGSLDETMLHEAANRALDRTRTGGDGPWVRQASFVAVDPKVGPDGYPYLGAILITLLPGGDPTDWDSYYWSEPAPPDLLENRQGWPHLTWIFVAPPDAGQGIGTALLHAAVRELLQLGYTELASTFLAGNDSSMLWHWRNDFRLLPYPGSQRLMRQRWLQRQRS